MGGVGEERRSLPPTLTDPMPSDETRRVLKIFGVAVTNLEDATTPEERAKWDAELTARTREIQDLIERLRTRPCP